jgi:RNA polymerase sigma factor (TIGR02999 family)
MTSAATSLSIDELYRELKRIAQRQLRGDGFTAFDATGLVHEAWLKLFSSIGEPLDRAHFCRLAARAMRQIIIDHARRRRLGAVKINGIGEAVGNEADLTFEVAVVERALTRLERTEPRLAEVLELHVYAGLAFAEIAALSGRGERSVYRDWRAARALIQIDLEGGNDG